MENTVAALDVLTVDEARRMLRVGKNAVYVAIRQGLIPHIKLGRSIRIPRKGLEAFLASGGSVTDSLTDSCGDEEGRAAFCWDERPVRSRTRRDR